MIGKLNQDRAKQIIDTLIKSSVTNFLIAPGSRSTPLTLAIAQNQSAKTIVHFDERGLGFLGLGLAKSTNTVVCILCTSGTALVNLYPAIVEASMNQIPLIILSADRPPELQQVGENQSIDQVNIFGRYLRFEVDIPLSDKAFSEKFLTKIVNQACYRAKTPPLGPVLLNIKIRKPFLSKNRSSKKGELPFQTAYYPLEKMLEEKDLLSIASDLSSFEKGAIVVGHLPIFPSLAPIALLAKKMQWPIFADPLSSLRSFEKNLSLIPFYNYILASSHCDKKPTILLYLGSAIVSKTLTNWIKALSLHKLYQVANFPNCHDSTYSVTDRIEMDPVVFCEKIYPFMQKRASLRWISYWQKFSLKAKELLETFFQKQKALSEPKAIFFLSTLNCPLPPLFFSNSLPVRYADALFFPQKRAPFLFGNRGASGIDGIIATCVGIAQGLKSPLFVYMGDLAFLHDLNSLAMAKKLSLPITFFILNNRGGGIFHFLQAAELADYLASFL